jgi:TPP-dependent trihydroxycyclohexane-1,2-dione (THcHDO) dehydratase
MMSVETYTKVLETREWIADADELESAITTTTERPSPRLVGATRVEYRDADGKLVHWVNSFPPGPVGVSRERHGAYRTRADHKKRFGGLDTYPEVARDAR